MNGLVAFASRARRSRSDPPPSWGSAVDRPRDLAGLAATWRFGPEVGEGTADAGGAHALDDHTWRDLALDAVFARVDRCVTRVGQHVLYRRLRRPSVEPGEVAELDQRVRAFAAHEPDRDLLREDLRRALRPLAARGADVAGLPSLLYSSLPPVPRLAKLFPFATFATIAAAAASVVWPIALLVLLGCVVANIALRLHVHGAMSLHSLALSALGPLLSAGRNVARLRAGALEVELAVVRAATEHLEAHRAAVSWLTLDTLRLNEITATVIAYLNVMLLVDANAFARSLGALHRSVAVWRALFETLGELDAARSIASYRAGLPLWATPVFTSRGAAMTMDGLVHPLLAAPVANDSCLRKNEGRLLLGSNMSGKSTHLRAVATSAIMAQALATAPCELYAAPVVVVRTLIHVEDDVLAGRSHFLSEAERARELLVEGRSSCGRLCVVDELFRGTNTVDRVAAGAAFLRALSRGGAYVVAATHDAELVGLLEGDFKPAHFAERVELGRLAYDYRLREGAAAPRNALAVLELAGFPSDVIADARASIPRVEPGRPAV